MNKGNKKLYLPVKNETTAAAKSLQSCPTLCNPIDGSPPGPTVPGILQARTLEWVAISSSNASKWKVKVKSPSHVRLLATPLTAAYQTPPSMGFSMQEYRNALPLPSPWYWIKQNKTKNPVFQNCGVLNVFPESSLVICFSLTQPLQSWISATILHKEITLEWATLHSAFYSTTVFYFTFLNSCWEVLMYFQKCEPYTVTEHKFMCPMHSEAKQTKASEFGAEKGLLQGHAKIGGSCPNNPNSS